MPKTLHITNGDTAAAMLAEGFDGPTNILPWRDVLHDGPIPKDLDFSSLCSIRAAFIHQALSRPNLPPHRQDDFADVAAAFQELVDTLHHLDDFEEVVLWFEHDLYDQLQLVAALSEIGLRENLTLVNIGAFEGVDPFDGFGNLTVEQLISLYPKRRTVTTEDIALAQSVWQALREDSPSALAGSLDQDMGHLPFLRKALIRFCQDYPWASDNLTLTEKLLLQAIERPQKDIPRLKKLLAHDPDRYAEIMAGPLGFGRLFNDYADREEHPFCGDLWVKMALDNLVALGLLEQTSFDPENPLSLATQYALTKQGRSVLKGTVRLDRHDCLYRGGVVISPTNPWRWDDTKYQFVSAPN